MSSPQSANECVLVIGEEGGLIWCSPMCHGTISDSFKNAFDWLQRLSDSKPRYLTEGPWPQQPTCRRSRLVEKNSTRTQMMAISKERLPVRR
jgi:NAD(P)H-dependent FMN reductase